MALVRTPRTPEYFAKQLQPFAPRSVACSESHSTLVYCRQTGGQATLLPSKYKKGNCQKPESYRPVSLSSVPSKVMESTIRDRLLQHLCDPGLLNKAQHGFLPKRSCSTQLLEALEDWSAAVEAGEPIDVAYLDFSKAFDSVPHQRLITRLHGYGIRGKVLDWITAFLLDRQQRVVIRSAKSNWTPVTNGIPQGSVLGPILFNIFVNDMPSQVSGCIKLFADDTKLYRHVTDGSAEFQADIDALARWSIKWLLPFNAAKFKVMHIGRHSHTTLGGLLPERLHHRKGYRGKGPGHHHRRRPEVLPANSGCHRKSLPDAGCREALPRYHQRGRPPPALQVHGQTLSGVRELDLGTPQHSRPGETGTSAAQGHPASSEHPGSPVPGPNTSSPSPLALLPRPRGDMITVFQLLHAEIAIEPEWFLHRSTSNQTRGHQWKLLKSRANTLTRRNALSTRVINAWNALLAAVVSATSVDQFKARLDRH